MANDNRPADPGSVLDKLFGDRPRVTFEEVARAAAVWRGELSDLPAVKVTEGIPDDTIAVVQGGEVRALIEGIKVA